MKKTALLSFGLFAAALVIAQELVVNVKPAPLPTADEAVFAWVGTEHDFGTIKQNVPASHEFRFTNTGTVPLIISAVQGSCGCTVANYTKDPIGPGQSGLVKATFNAASLGQFTKSVTVTANTTEGTTRLLIKGEVVK